ncbi:isochorismatase [Photobacterium rosenbergii]|uniref:Isochorismatase n=1 Tax=Photobacterium rosenbergii TaxID=294936 RepID=A0A2T3NJT8_9GAMM|nr:isochorismatase family cysteine hydrolase [Photobacterium rosenbergii]PSW15781.1 isochorismatase [Photobacterium rosenbergii]
MKRNATALILIDPQNDFLSEDGKLYEAVKPVLDKTNVIEKLNGLLDKFHENDMMVIHTPITIEPDQMGNPDDLYGVMKPVAQSGGFIRGSKGAQVADVLNTDESDLIIEKHHICAFEGTDLDKVLRENGIETVVLAGLLTDVCVEATMRIAYDRGYEVYTVTDATATLDEAKQNMTVEYSYPLFSKPVLAENIQSII